MTGIRAHVTKLHWRELLALGVFESLFLLRRGTTIKLVSMCKLPSLWRIVFYLIQIIFEYEFFALLARINPKELQCNTSRF